jgi:hypothetical protein
MLSAVYRGLCEQVAAFYFITAVRSFYLAAGETLPIAWRCLVAHRVRARFDCDYFPHWWHNAEVYRTRT